MHITGTECAIYKNTYCYDVFEIRLRKIVVDAARRAIANGVDDAEAGRLREKLNF